MKQSDIVYFKLVKAKLKELAVRIELIKALQEGKP